MSDDAHLGCKIALVTPRQASTLASRARGYNFTARSPRTPFSSHDGGPQEHSCGERFPLVPANGPTPTSVDSAQASCGNPTPMNK
jgi:hypothetical protein